MPEENSEIKQGETPEVAEEKPAASSEAAPDKPIDQPQRTTTRPERADSRETMRPRPERRGRRGYYDAGEGKDKEAASDHGSRVPKFKRKLCNFCQDNNLPIDYKRPDILEHFITDRGKILPRRITGTCSKHQRIVAREIKRARIISLLPFVEQ